jgi:hypothetical protein
MAPAVARFRAENGVTPSRTVHRAEAERTPRRDAINGFPWPRAAERDSPLSTGSASKEAPMDGIDMVIASAVWDILWKP